MIADLLEELAQTLPPLPGAACKGRGEIMDVATARDREPVARAQAVCAECPALQACSEWLARVPKYRLPTGVVAGRFVKPPALRPLREPKPKPETKRDRAARWLADYLSDGPVISTQVRADATAAGIEAHTLAAARRRLGVELERINVHGGARWWSLNGRSAMSDIPGGFGITVSHNEIDGVEATRTTETVDFVAPPIMSKEDLKRRLYGPEDE